MPPTEQAELWMALRDRMKENWAELTTQEKKAGTSQTVSISRELVQTGYGIRLPCSLLGLGLLSLS